MVDFDRMIERGRGHRDKSSHGLIESSSLGSSATGTIPVVRHRDGRMYRIRGRVSLANGGQM